MDRATLLWVLADLLREFRRQRLWWRMHDGPTLDESMRQWWDRQRA